MMRIQHEHRSGLDRRRHFLDFSSRYGIEQRWGKDCRSHVLGLEGIDESEAAISDEYWERLLNISPKDGK